MGVWIEPQLCGCTLMQPDNSPSYIVDKCGDENCAAKVNLRQTQLEQPYPSSLHEWICEDIQYATSRLAKAICNKIANGEFILDMVDDTDAYVTVNMNFKLSVTDTDLEYVQSRIKE